MNPELKIESFKDFLEKGSGAKADIAFFKFCYVDIHSQTDIEKIFNAYKTVMTELKLKYPNVVFVHITIPLTSEPTGLKGITKKLKMFVKSVLGKPEMFDNRAKLSFNEMMRKEYRGKEPLFDLAKIESTDATGSRVSNKKDGKIVYSLANEYTNDGGHLNEKGRKKVAKQLLMFLINL